MGQTATVTVIRADAIWTGGTEPKTHHHRDLVIEDGTVIGIEEDYTGRVDLTIDATGCLVVPGLVNCHTHAGARHTRAACQRIWRLSAERGVLPPGIDYTQPP